MKVFSTKFWGMPHPLMLSFKQSVKVFSVKFSLPIDPRKFSPSKVYRYMVSIILVIYGNNGISYKWPYELQNLIMNVCEGSLHQ